ncbi:MAG TPA: tetraacyldisaccharide 4'-kinase [Gemmatimonadaceae bacterium]
MSVINAVWSGDSVWAVLARASLAPASLLFRLATTARNALYDRGTLPVIRAGIPVVSVGNLAVGGTGKTPVSAWFVSELAARGAQPAIILRGYGGDEPLVHERLNPGVRVITGADRVSGARIAAAAGADVAVLDDAFQHRRLARDEDIVLVSADRWREPIRVLPAGPWREQLASMARATFVIVTRKAAGMPDAAALLDRLAPLTRTGLGAVVSLELGDLHDAVTGAVRPLSVLRETRVLVAAGIGDPAALAAQLRQAGADVTMRSFSDHHVYESSDIANLVRDAHTVDHVVSTLKDAVKLAPRWPREGPPLWYVSLRCRIDAGQAEVYAMLDRILAARLNSNSTGAAGRASTTLDHDH